MGSQRLPKRAPTPLRRTPPVALEGAPTIVLPAHWHDKIAAVRWPWPDAPILANVLDRPEKNNFGSLRLLLAFAVLVSHAVFLATGDHAAEPLAGLTGYSLGQYGVQGFFILSGLLVAQSLGRRDSLRDFLFARAVRILPALVVCVMATALLLGPALTYFRLPGYFTSIGLYQYLATTLSLSSGSAHLPGLFELNPVGGAVNQSIWTLKYEVSCYLALGGLAAVIGSLDLRRPVVAIALGLWTLVMLVLRPSLGLDPNFVGVLSYFGLFFGTGVAAYLLRDHIRISWQPLPMLFLLFVIGFHSDLAEITSAAFIGYGLLWLSTVETGALRTETNASDYSYGVYIYSFPVTQVVLALWPGIHVISLLALTVAATLVLAFLSWELVERPCLALVRQHLRSPRRTGGRTGGRIGERSAVAMPGRQASAVRDVVTTGASIAVAPQADAAFPPAHASPPVMIRSPSAYRPAADQRAAAARAAESPVGSTTDRSRLSARMAQIVNGAPAGPR